MVWIIIECAEIGLWYCVCACVRVCVRACLRMLLDRMEMFHYENKSASKKQTHMLNNIKR